MISSIDRNRVLTFVGITFGIVIVAASVIFFDGGHKSDFAPVTPLAIISNLIDYAPEGIVGCLGYVLLALPILLIPSALAYPRPAPTTVAVLGNPESMEKTSGQAKLGTVS